MLDEVRSLLILQDRDRRLLSIAKDLEKLPQDEARARTKLADDEQAVATAKEAVQKAEMELKNLELDAETRKTTITRLKTQQFETRKNDEYQALGNEIVRYEKQLDELETRELEVMETIDDAKTKLKEAKDRLAHTQKLVDEDLASIRQRHESRVAEQKEVQSEREKIAADIPDSILPLYERLMKSKNGLAVARMHEGKCEGCHMKLIPSTIAAVQNGKEVTRCEDCGRILYLAE
ncbi:MAG: C4-type zinc ribbon domain-containing protein [Akkermansiaceae bacterium]|nr:C4-type zinc ribbon domain-containing protein [Akkermansiaceae bacterium]